MTNPTFPFYSANIKDSFSLGDVSLEYFINAHKNPTAKVKSIIDKANEAAKRGDLKTKNELKSSLYTFTPAVKINKGERRMYKNVKGYTGLIQLDFDKIDSKEMALELKADIFNNHKEIICSYISPSGLGVKCLMSITQAKDREQFRKLYFAIEREFEGYSFFDTAVKNAVLPLYLSYDLDILHRTNPTIWTDEYDKPELHQPNPNYIPQTFTDNQAKYFYDKTVRIYSDKINQINTEGHPTVRDASLILGHRVAAGYISLNEAESLAINLIKANAYLKKGTSGYLKTALSRIKIGLEYPLEY